MVVAPEKREEILREVALVAVAERAHDAEVERDVLAVMRRIDGDKDVARMHVGMKKAVTEHLRKKDLDTSAGKLLQVDGGARQFVDPADRDAGHPLHHQHFGVGPVPVDFRHEQQRRMLEVAPQLRAVRRLARQVEFVVDRLVELGDDLARFQPLALFPQPLDQRRRGLHQREIVFDDACDVRPQHLDRHQPPGLGANTFRQFGEMYLRDRRACDRHGVERHEDLVERLAVDAR